MIFARVLEYMNEKLKKFITKNYYKGAKALADNPEGLNFKFQKISEKLSRAQIKESLGRYFQDFMTLLKMTKSWSTGEYRDISKSSITYSILCLIYFLTPTDFVPDFLIGLGLLDDIAVLKWTLEKIKLDIEKYKIWESEK